MNKRIMLEIDLYWSMRSPYCYLALDRILALNTEPDVMVKIKHVWPGAMRRKGYFSSLNSNYPRYHKRDTARIAEFLGLPYGRPRPDPLVFDRQTREPLDRAQQPYIGRLTRMAQLAVERGAGMLFLDNIMRTIWNGKIENWDRGNHLKRAITAAGLDFPELTQRAGDEKDRLDAIIDSNGEDLSNAGHWGVPCMIFQSEPFFGQDRIELLRWRLEQVRSI